MPTITDHIASAQNAFEAGFGSKAAQKRATDDLNRAYDKSRDALMNAILTARTAENEEANHADYWSTTSDLHLVRDKHLATFTKYGQDAALIADLVALRAAIKAAPIQPAPAKDQTEVKAAAIRKSIIEEMETRKAQFVRGLDITRCMNEWFPRKDGKSFIPVSVNAHWVRGHKGTDFVRYFFYLGGKLTALNTIIAVAETYRNEAAK